MGIFPLWLMSRYKRLSCPLSDRPDHHRQRKAPSMLRRKCAHNTQGGSWLVHSGIARNLLEQAKWGMSGNRHSRPWLVLGLCSEQDENHRRAPSLTGTERGDQETSEAAQGGTQRAGHRRKEQVSPSVQSPASSQQDIFWPTPGNM